MQVSASWVPASAAGGAGDRIGLTAANNPHAGSNDSVPACTCTTSDCHGSGVTIRTSPVWISTTALVCVDGCHGGDPSRTGVPSNHRRSQHKKSCATCHTSVVDANHTILVPALHVERRQERPVLRREVELQPMNKSCTGTGNGCHGAGTRTGW